MFLVSKCGLELVVDAESDNALVNLADDSVTILEVDSEVIIQFIFKAGTNVETDVVALSLAIGIFIGFLLVICHRVIDTSQWIEVELMVGNVEQVVGIEVDVPA